MQLQPGSTIPSTQGAVRTDAARQPSRVFSQAACSLAGVQRSTQRASHLAEAEDVDDMRRSRAVVPRLAVNKVLIGVAVGGAQGGGCMADGWWQKDPLCALLILKGWLLLRASVLATMQPLHPAAAAATATPPAAPTLTPAPARRLPLRTGLLHAPPLRVPSARLQPQAGGWWVKVGGLGCPYRASHPAAGAAGPIPTTAQRSVAQQGALWALQAHSLAEQVPRRPTDTHLWGCRGW